MATNAAEEMEQARDGAREELLEHWDEWTAQALGEWWVRWYLKAGHKRLGRLLVEFAKNPSVEPR